MCSSDLIRDILPTFVDVAGGKVPQDIDGNSLLPLLQQEKPVWREYIDLEHATCYSPHNYWCALTDGKMKYIWFFRTGKEQLFNIEKDPYERTDLSGNKKQAKTLAVWRERMVKHLSERGEEYVKDGQLQQLSKTRLYSPQYPAGEREQLRYWMKESEF